MHMPRANEQREQGSWQKPAITALWVVLTMFAGWMWTTNADAAKATAEKIAATDAVVHQSQERLATLEEAARNTRESLQRIEAGINELRREHK